MRLFLVAVTKGVPQVLVQLRDHVERDLLGTRPGTLTDVRATPEAFVVVLRDHLDDAAVALGLSLRKLTEMGDLGADEQRGRTVRAGRHAGAAADAGRDVEGTVGVV